MILCGDFDLPDIDWSRGNPSPTINSREAILMCDLISDFNLQQLVMESTREKNILELLITNRVDIIDVVEVVDGLPGSDHNAVEFQLNLHMEKTC